MNDRLQKLRDAGPEKWQEGLCAQFACALREITGEGKFVAIRVACGFRHVMIQIEDKLIDSTGIYSEEEHDERFRKKFPDWPVDRIKVFDEFEELKATYGGGNEQNSRFYSGEHHADFVAEARAFILENLEKYRITPDGSGTGE